MLISGGGGAYLREKGNLFEGKGFLFEGLGEPSQREGGTFSRGGECLIFIIANFCQQEGRGFKYLR